MGFRSLRSLVRGSMRARICTSSSGIAVQRALGSAAWSEADALHSLRKLAIKHPDAAFATLSVAVFSVFAGILHIYDDEFDEARKEGTPTRTSRYLHSHQMLYEVRRERASYHKTVRDEKALVQEYMEEDKAMKAKFEEWIKEHGRIYKDELEKARRFKIFKAAARCADAYNADAAKAGHSARFGLSNFSDWNAQEIAPLLGGSPTSRDGGYLRMIMHYLAEQEIWHQVSSAMNKVHI